MITREKLSRGDGELVEKILRLDQERGHLKVRIWHQKKDFLKMKESFKKLYFPCRRW
jgi:hypothetical protein